MSAKNIFALVVIAGWLLPVGCLAQTRVYKNYNVKDGLAGTTVYNAYQDKKGFMWFGTDQGLSRFDGTNFKTYTTRDGLPDNDVFKMAEDSMGRLWMICYNSKPCFMYKRVIHNSDNDTLLQNIEDESRFFKNLFIDKQGRTWIMGLKLYMVDKNKVTRFDAPDAPYGMGYIDNRLTIVLSKGVYELILNNDSAAYHLVSPITQADNSNTCYANNNAYVVGGLDGKNALISKVSRDTASEVNLLSVGIKDVILNHLSFNPKDSSLLVSVPLQGIKAFSADLRLLPDPFPFLPTGISYADTWFDMEGNTWITTLEKGVFFIPVNKTVQYRLNDNTTVTTVYRAKNGGLFTGFDHPQYGVLENGKLTSYPLRITLFSGKRIIRYCYFDKTNDLMGADFGLYIVDRSEPLHRQIIDSFCVKNMMSEGEDSILLGRPNDASRIIKTGLGFEMQKLWDERTTAIAKDKAGQIWLGSLNGLFIYRNGSVKRYDENPLISKSRITDLLCDNDGNIWVATNQRGVFVIGKDSTAAINSRNGLPSDVCIRFFKENDSTVWICTNRNVSQITRRNGFLFDVWVVGELSGDVTVSVNDVSVDSADIWVATSEGLFQIEKGNQGKPLPPPVYITAFASTDSVFTNFSNPQLKYFQNNIQIDYIGISYNSAGKLAYKYLLLSGSTDTVFTRNTTLNFNGLPPGKYDFRVWAKTMAGIWSRTPAVIEFEIFPPFWKTWWFIFYVMLSSAFALWLFVRRRIQAIRMRENEKTVVNKKIAEIELQAVRAQMNEHFIFNSLNSIQNFINQNNTEAANFYLASFGKLIRRTMDISAMPSISLQDELDYLGNYLTLEKMRFGDKFDYSITSKIITISAEELIFPSMILQPYVENAIRHGLRHKTEGKGKLSISFYEEKGFLVCAIDDNGVGRKRAQELKSKSGIEYQSKGIRLSEDKVYLFNLVHNQKIRVATQDKTDEHGNATGTLVKVYVPLNINL